VVAPADLHDCPDCRRTHGAKAPCAPDALWTVCEPLATQSRILDALLTSLASCGLAGETEAAQLLYLVMTARHFAQPLSAIVKGPSAAGKSQLVDKVTRHFSPSAYDVITSMSPTALVYGTTPIKHKVLVFAELAGVDDSEKLTYLLRVLLSEGVLKHEVTERDSETGQFVTRRVVREGPTGLLITTTAVSWHEENESRCLSVFVDDSPAQTRLVMRALAAQHVTVAPDLSLWHAFDKWLTTGEHRVAVPFAPTLADAIPPVSVTLRRGFPRVMALVMAHALLHRAGRDRDDDGRILANLDDYAVIRELVAETFEAQHDVKVPEKLKDTVDAVKRLTMKGDPTSVTWVARHLEVDVSTASRRVKTALEKGYLQNLEPRDGRPFKLVLGDPLPSPQTLLPTHDVLAALQTVVSTPQPPSLDDTSTSPDPCTVAPKTPLPDWVTADAVPDLSDPIGARDVDVDVPVTRTTCRI
jgi:hypothetical protein